VYGIYLRFRLPRVHDENKLMLHHQFGTRGLLYALPTAGIPPWLP
jgi:hypothetical protein